MSATGTPFRVFISYRRDDSQGLAGRIYDRLCRHFGEEGVFRDINDIEPGRPWAEAIDAALDSCDVFVLLIGRGWLGAVDDKGKRRLDDPRDRHRREIETALNRHILMFVALMENAPMPDRGLLPKEAAHQQTDGDKNRKGLQEILDLQSIVIADFAFDYGIDRLITSIETAARHEGADAAKRGRELVTEREREDVAKPQPEDRQRKRRFWLLGAVALGAAVVIVGAFLLIFSGAEEAPPVVAQVSVGQHPIGLAAGAGEETIWVADRDETRVRLIEATPGSQELNEDFRGTVGQSADGVAVDDNGSVWVACHGSDDVWELDPESGALAQRIGVGDGPAGIAVGNDGSVWVSLEGDNEVARIDPESGNVDQRIPVGDHPYGVTVDDGGLVWVTNRQADPPSVSQIKPGRDEQVGNPIPVGANPKGIDAADAAVWVANTDEGSVTKINRENTDDRETFTVGALPRDVVVAFGSVWVSLGGDNQVVRLDPETGEMEDPIPIDASDSEGIAEGQDSVWVANGDAGTVTRISP
jgi:YVTN family beta-propeller protein